MFPGPSLPLIGILLLVAGCASHEPSSASGGFPPGKSSPPATAPASVSTGDHLADIALSMVGTRYQFGGETPEGFDCSGLVYYAYKQLGIAVPRTSRAQRHAVRNVPSPTIRRGDLLFFDTSWKSGHVGIYVGDDRFVHAPSSGKRVTVTPLTEGYFASRLRTAGRLHN